MKKMVLVGLLAATAIMANAQNLPTVAVATFDTAGGVTADEAAVVTELFMAELVSKGTVNVVDRVNFDKIVAEMRFQTSDWSNSQKTAQLGSALNAQYVIRGQLMKMGNVIYWTATMINVNTAQVLYSAREQINDLGQIYGKLPAFCAQMLDKVPMPNYFVGRWRSSGGICSCILDFRANGSIIVEQYDTFRSGDSKRGRGTGNYSYDTKSITIMLSLTNVVVNIHAEWESANLSKSIYKYI